MEGSCCANHPAEWNHRPAWAAKAASFAVPKAGLKKHLNLGDKYLTDMDYENAILAYKDAIEIDPIQN